MQQRRNEINIDDGLLANFTEPDEEELPLPKTILGFDLLPNINEIDYLCGAKYRG